jgi:stress response protein YsnF
VSKITVESTIQDQIIVAQKENKGIVHIKEKVRKEKPRVSELMKQMSCDSKIVWSYPRFLNYVR